jgi:hypothetical protein
MAEAAFIDATSDGDGRLLRLGGVCTLANAAAIDAAVGRISQEPPRTVRNVEAGAITALDTIQVYRGARWRDAAPAMLQELMLQAFQCYGNTITRDGSSRGPPSAFRPAGLSG